MIDFSDSKRWDTRTLTIRSIGDIVLFDPIDWIDGDPSVVGKPCSILAIDKGDDIEDVYYTIRLSNGEETANICEVV